MKTTLAGGVALTVLACAAASGAGTSAAWAASAASTQAPDTAAGTEYAPKPTPQEEFVYLRDIVSLQALRLDQAEQTLKKQNALIEAQAAKIQQLETALGDMRRTAAYGGPVPAGVHVVKSGDTLSKIAQRYGASVSALARRNNIKAPYRLSVGQRIAYGVAAPQASAQVAQAPTPQPAAQPQQKAQTRTAEAAPKQEKVESKPRREAPQPQRVAANTTKPQDKPDDKKSDEPEQVGVRPDEDYDRPYLPITADVGGILTPKGTMWVEPSITFTTASDNRFFFQGISVENAVLIGAIEATDSDRRAHIESVGLRYGITSRFEVDGRISYVNRDDRISGVSIGTSLSDVENIRGRGIGDAEFGLHYQLTNGRKFPYTIANLRVKTPTGTGPFELDRTSNGIETEVAVGSGFWTIEPSLTFSIPTSPAVIFANIGYQKNILVEPDLLTRIPNRTQVLGRDLTGQLAAAAAAEGVGATDFVDQFTLTDNLLREFAPGDALRTNIGVGLSLNEKLSINFAYDQSYYFPTQTTTVVTERTAIFPQSDGFQGRDFDDADIIDELTEDPEIVFREQPAATVGSFLFGGSYAVSSNFRVGLTAGIGATDEAPDINVSLRASYKLFD